MLLSRFAMKETSVLLLRDLYIQKTNIYTHEKCLQQQIIYTGIWVVEIEPNTRNNISKSTLTYVKGLCFHWVLKWTFRDINQKSTHGRTKESDYVETQHTDWDVKICLGSAPHAALDKAFKGHSCCQQIAYAYVDKVLRMSF